jgi:hypothetical protein
MKTVMVTREFGSPIYIAPSSDNGINVTDKIEEAEIWGDMDLGKIQYHRAITCFNELTFEPLNVCP